MRYKKPHKPQDPGEAYRCTGEHGGGKQKQQPNRSHTKSQALCGLRSKRQKVHFMHQKKHKDKANPDQHCCRLQSGHGNAPEPADAKVRVSA